MHLPAHPNPALDPEELHSLLAVTRALAAPFELKGMLATVTAAACQVLHAERASVWMLDDDGRHLRLEVTSDLGALRLPLGQGLVGCCAAEGRLVNVPDCYADPRFNAELDRRSGFRTRCLIAVPLVDHRGVLVGVLQVLNRREGVFGPADEALAEALAAQCAVALSRVRMLDAMRAAERLQHEVALASELQRSTLPAAPPQVAGYALHGAFRPASQTGGDTWDLAPAGDEITVLLADAAGHGLPAALAVVQLHAMLRLALDGPADLADAWRRVNNRLADTWREGGFATAFVGRLDPRTHRLRYISGGQSPILLWRAAQARCEVRGATLFPMGAMPLDAAPRVEEVTLAPGDALVLLSDGFHEYEDAQGRAFGRRQAQDLLARHAGDSPVQLVDAFFAAVRQHAGSAPQMDDMTAVVVARLPVARDPAPALVLRVGADAAGAAAAQQALQAMATGLSLPARTLYRAELVVEELVVNAGLHGGAHEVEISATLQAGALVLQLQDDGRPFDPLEASSPLHAWPALPLPAPGADGGRGLLLVRKAAREWTCTRRQGHNHQRLVIDLEQA